MEEEAPSAFTTLITKIFYPILNPIFDPLNRLFAAYYEPYATICALALFLAGASMAAFVLKKEYVNLDAPGKGLRYDLRFWAFVAVLPHMLAYLYFVKW